MRDILEVLWNICAWTGILCYAFTICIVLWMTINDIEDRIKYKKLEKQKNSTAYQDHIGFLNRKDDLT